MLRKQNGLLDGCGLRKAPGKYAPDHVRKYFSADPYILLVFVSLSTHSICCAAAVEAHSTGIGPGSRHSRLMHARVNNKHCIQSDMMLLMASNRRGIFGTRRKAAIHLLTTECPTMQMIKNPSIFSFYHHTFRRFSVRHSASILCIVGMSSSFIHRIHLLAEKQKNTAKTSKFFPFFLCSTQPCLY